MAWPATTLEAFHTVSPTSYSKASAPGACEITRPANVYLHTCAKARAHTVDAPASCEPVTGRCACTPMCASGRRESDESLRMHARVRVCTVAHQWPMLRIAEAPVALMPEVASVSPVARTPPSAITHGRLLGLPPRCSVPQ
jgi:hypothetical protein